VETVELEYPGPQTRQGMSILPWVREGRHRPDGGEARAICPYLYLFGC
jgi:hypothetical protein